jgi:hypothetical protein
MQTTETMNYQGHQLGPASAQLLAGWTGQHIDVVAFWEAFYIEHKRFDLDTLRVPNGSPTPISKSNDFLGQSDDIWGARGPISGGFGGFPGSGPAKKLIFLSPLKRPPRRAYPELPRMSGRLIPAWAGKVCFGRLARPVGGDSLGCLSVGVARSLSEGRGLSRVISGA